MKPSLDDLVTCIRDHQRIRKSREITSTTRLEADLGITGDDGCELLEEVERRFCVSFVGKDGSLRDAFQLEKDQYLFHSEGFPSFLNENVKPLTVGELFQVLISR